MPEQMRLRTILAEDQVFRSWMAKQPKITVVHHQPPWRLFVQQEQGGKWGRVDLPSYTKAYEQMKLRLPDAWDMAIHCKPQFFAPPMVTYKGKPWPAPMPEEHVWCMLCRRPTIFRTFRKHPNLRTVSNGEELRCLICGMRRVMMKDFLSPVSWPSEVKP